MDNDKSSQIKKLYHFDEFRLDAKDRRLWRGDELIPLTPKEFEVLFFLVARAGRVVEKSELLDAVWADAFVEETTLARNISWLRKKIGNGADGVKFIETIPKRGYCFVAEVKTHSEANAPANKENTIEENAFVVEEQTIWHLEIEETLTLAPEGTPENLMIAPDTPRQLNSPADKRKRKLIPLGVGVLAAVIFFAVYQFLNWQPAQKIVTVSSVVPFSGLPGREDMPAFSPDGKLLAFVWNGGSDEDLNVYVKQIGTGDPIQLTKNLADDLRPTFSPDGSEIAFVRVLPGKSEVFLIPALGGAERKIAELRRSSSGVSFSPDGRFLAVHDGNNESDERPGIFLINIQNGAKGRLTAPPELAADDRPVFAPDGQSIIFIRSFGQVTQELFIIPTKGGEARQLTFDKSRIGGAAWTADGQKIVFASLRKYNNQTNIWQIEAGGAEALPELIATGGKRLTNPAISKDNRTVAFVEESYRTSIRRLELNKFPARDTWRKFAPSSFNDNSPNVSPDNSRVAFASQRTGKYEIWISEADGSNVRQLTDLKYASGSPRFSPDGKFVAFDAQNNGNSDIFVIPADGGEPRRITDSPAFDFMPAWSADGNFLYFASDRSGGAAQIYKISISDSGKIKQITQNGGRESFAAPDGKSLYYTKDESQTGLWRVSGEGGEEQQVAELAEAGPWRYWTMTKTGIYYVQNAKTPPYKIMFYDFATTRTTEKAATDAFPVWVYPGLAASEDGDSIYYTQSEQNVSSIMIADLID